PLDVHLMLDRPQEFLKPFLDAGAHCLTVHVEAEGLRTESVLRSALDTIRRAGARPGLSLRPRTAAEALRPFLDAVDLVLVMTVEPGFGGQAFLPEAVPKVRQLREWFTGDLAVDGGINALTGRQWRSGPRGGGR
ncbi:MAG: ribulose-phosphate 3-epimerase, partial [Elusimicrobia bacterium]